MCSGEREGQREGQTRQRKGKADMAASFMHNIETCTTSKAFYDKEVLFYLAAITNQSENRCWEALLSIFLFLGLNDVDY
jgi:hypothetical protein